MSDSRFNSANSSIISFGSTEYLVIAVTTKNMSSKKLCLRESQREAKPLLCVIARRRSRRGNLGGVGVPSPPHGLLRLWLAMTREKKGKGIKACPPHKALAGGG